MTCNQSVAVKSIDPGSPRQISDVRFQMHCCHKPRPGSGKGRRATADRFLWSLCENASAMTRRRTNSYSGQLDAGMAAQTEL
jgi:hypothetical protein